jgi:uncharacterized membrane protein YkvA (DUF1232 family)
MGEITMAMSRWGVFRTLATALRTAVRPGGPGMGERLSALPRLLRATFRGEYRGTTAGKLFLVAAAAAYVLSPFDLVPEAFLSIFGLADDAVVVTWIAATIVNETDAYLAWERGAAGAPGTGSAGSARSRRDRAPRGESAQAQTVPGEVVR